MNRVFNNELGDGKWHHKVLMVVLIITGMTPVAWAGSVEVGTQFTYQGELLDGGAPANGVYDLIIQLYPAATGGSALDFVVINDIEIVNGLINTEVDFGDLPFSGEARFLEVNIRPGDSTAGYSILTPRTRINATPYAIQSAFVENGASLWDDINGGIAYDAGNVRIGNTSNTTAKLHVEANVGQDPVRMRINGNTKFRLHDNGGSSLGINRTPPVDGLYVFGEVRQPLNRHGFAKAGLRFTCGNANTTIFESFNNENSDSFSISNSLPEAGRCVVTVPFDIADVYISASPFATNIVRGVSCGKTTDGGGADVIECNAYNPLSGSRNDAVITLLLF